MPEDSIEERSELVERQLRSGVALGMGRIGMCFGKHPVYTYRGRRTRQCRNELWRPAGCGTGRWTLYRMRGIEDHRKAGGAHRDQPPEVHHQIVITERRAAFRKPHMRVACLHHLGCGLHHVFGCHELRLFDVHHAAGGSSCFQQTGLPTQERRDLQNVHRFSNHSGLGIGVNVRESWYAKGLSDLGQDLQGFQIANPTKGTGTRAVGLTIRAFEDELYWLTAGNLNQMLSCAHRHVSAFDQTWTGDQDQPRGIVVHHELQIIHKFRGSARQRGSMASRTPDHTPPRRNTRNRVRTTEPEDTPSLIADSPDPDSTRRIKIAGVLLGIFALLLLLALVSYTSKDEANAQLSMRDLLGVVRGDAELRAKFDTTHNWLGLLGAVIANWLYVSTIGIWSIALPVLMLFWARDLVRHQRITPLVRKRSVAAIIVAILVSGVFSTAELVGERTTWFPTVDRVLCGSVGQFIAGTLSQFIGTIGSFAVLLLGISFVLVYGFDIEPERVRVFTRLVVAKVKGAFPSSSADEEEEVDDEEEEEVEESPRGRKLGGGAVIRPKTKRVDDEEPAEMLRSTTDQDPDKIGRDVRIVRPGTPRGRGTGTSASDPVEPEASDVPDTRSIQERLKALHPDKQIRVGTDRGPSEPGDEPELPLFLSDDDEDESVEATIPDGVPARQLTISVEDGPDEAAVDLPLRSVTLYDEEIAYKPPSPSLLVDEADEAAVDDEELRQNAQILQDKLETFRIKIENVTVQPGPVVTQYEFVPASGVKVASIESLADDIALALKAPAVRIIAPIPGKGTVGIEIPNHKPSIVRFGSIIKSPKYHNPDIKLPIAMGKTVVGEVYCADLAKMPHLLIAGATGKGKSVGINSIIASLLYRMHPKDVKFVIIDPKRVEMSLYKALKNHFLAMSPDIDETIITEPQNAVAILKSVVEEMSMRYNVLAAAGQRNIAEYNRKVKDGKIKEKGGMMHRPMPYLVVIIDELADLMMTASKEVEEPIVRLAQLARAVGIHCVVATQRPSVDVVTGLIKANFPARIAYQVTSRIDSRTIIDGSGAEHLIGNGDMLFVPGNTPKPIRMQNAFISTEEVEAICEHIGKQKGYSQPYMLPSINKRGGGGAASADDRDALFEDAARIFIQLQQASVSTLQRRLKVGYARAARIVDELESAGIVGPPDGAKGRAVLLQSESELEAYL